MKPLNFNVICHICGQRSIIKTQKGFACRNNKKLWHISLVRKALKQKKLIQIHQIGGKVEK